MPFTDAEIAAGAAIAFTKLAGIPYFEDTQTTGITATGVLTGISITPGAGTYFGLCVARVSAGGGTLSLRVNGVNVKEGPFLDAEAGQGTPLVVFGVITPTAGQAVEAYWYEVGTASCSEGQMFLLRIGA